MSLCDVKQVVDLTEIVTVNKYLEAGWVLVDTYRTCWSDEVRDETLHYVLGWPSSEPPMYPDRR